MHFIFAWRKGLNRYILAIMDTMNEGSIDYFLHEFVQFLAMRVFVVTFSEQKNFCQIGKRDGAMFSEERHFLETVFLFFFFLATSRMKLTCPNLVFSIARRSFLQGRPPFQLLLRIEAPSPFPVSQRLSRPRLRALNSEGRPLKLPDGRIHIPATARGPHSAKLVPTLKTRKHIWTRGIFHERIDVFLPCSFKMKWEERFF